MMQLSTFSSYFLSLKSKYSWLSYNENRCYKKHRRLLSSEVAHTCEWRVRPSFFD